MLELRLFVQVHQLWLLVLRRMFGFTMRLQTLLTLTSTK